MMCRRWRARYQDAKTFTAAAGGEVWAFTHSTLVHIAATERSHGIFRHSLRHAGPARNVDAAIDRMVGREALSAHIAQGGSAPTLASVVDLAMRKMDVRAGGAGAQSGPSAKNGRYGSSYIEFLNLKMSTYKTLHSKDRSMTADERADVRRRAYAEWQELVADPAQTDGFEQLRQCKKRFRIEGDRRRPEQNVHSGPRTGLWGAETEKHFPFNLDAFATFHKDERAAAAHRGPLARKDNVVSSPPERCHSIPSDAMSLVCGCYGARKNVCRDHVAMDFRADIDQLQHYVNKWIHTFPDDTLQALTLPLLWFHSTSEADSSGDGEDVDMVVCLADFCKSPKTQQFVICILCSLEKPSLRFRVPAPPFRCRMMIGPQRMSHAADGLMNWTSDELFFYMAKSSRTWSLIPLTWELADDTADLLTMVVTGTGDPWVAPEVKVAPNYSRAAVTRACRGPVQRGRDAAALAGGYVATELEAMGANAVPGVDFSDSDDDIAGEFRKEAGTAPVRAAKARKDVDPLFQEEEDTDDDIPPPPGTENPDAWAEQVRTSASKVDDPVPRGQEHLWVKIEVEGGFILYSKTKGAFNAHCTRAGHDGPRQCKCDRTFKGSAHVIGRQLAWLRMGSDEYVHDRGEHQDMKRPMGTRSFQSIRQDARSWAEEFAQTNSDMREALTQEGLQGGPEPATVR